MRSSVDVDVVVLVVVALVLGRYRGRIIPAVCDADAAVDAAGGGAKASAALPFAPHRAARAAAVVVRARLLLIVVADGRCWGLCDWRAIFANSCYRSCCGNESRKSNGSIGGMCSIYFKRYDVRDIRRCCCCRLFGWSMVLAVYEWMSGLGRM